MVFLLTQHAFHLDAPQTTCTASGRNNMEAVRAAFCVSHSLKSNNNSSLQRAVATAEKADASACWMSTVAFA